MLRKKAGLNSCFCCVKSRVVVRLFSNFRYQFLVSNFTVFTDNEDCPCSNTGKGTVGDQHTVFVGELFCSEVRQDVKVFDPLCRTEASCSKRKVHGDNVSLKTVDGSSFSIEVSSLCSTDRCVKGRNNDKKLCFIFGSTDCFVFETFVWKRYRRSSISDIYVRSCEIYCITF